MLYESEESHRDTKVEELVLSLIVEDYDADELASFLK
jgi:hypothetical protein